MNLEQLRNDINDLFKICKEHGFKPSEVEVKMGHRALACVGCDIKDNQEVYLLDTSPEDHERNFQLWTAKYRPESNPFETGAGFDGNLFETCGSEFDYVRGQPRENVWTLTSWEREDFLIPGLELVNRMGYFVTQVPFDAGIPPQSIIIGRDLSEDEEELERRVAARQKESS